MFLRKAFKNCKKMNQDLRSLGLTFAAVAVSLHQGAPGWVSLAGKSAHVQVANGQPDD